MCIAGIKDKAQLLVASLAIRQTKQGSFSVWLT